MSHSIRRRAEHNIDVAAAGQYDVVSELLSAGAKVDAANEKGQTAL